MGLPSPITFTQRRPLLFPHGAAALEETCLWPGRIKEQPKQDSPKLMWGARHSLQGHPT